MLSQIITVLLVVAAVLVTLFGVAAGGHFVLWLRAKRATQTSIAAKAGLDSLTALAATLTLSVEGEVRDLKDRNKPGQWNPATDGPMFLARVVRDMKRLGGDAVKAYQKATRVDAEGMAALLEQLAESQVQALRARLVTPTIPPPPPSVIEVRVGGDVEVMPEALGQILPAAHDAGERGSASIAALIWTLVMGGLLILGVITLVSVTGCGPAQRAAAAVLPVPEGGVCRPRAQRCAGASPEACSDRGAWWPILPRFPDGGQRQCMAGCQLSDDGRAYCPESYNHPGIDGGL